MVTIQKATDKNTKKKIEAIKLVSGIRIESVIEDAGRGNDIYEEMNGKVSHKTFRETNKGLVLETK